MDAYDRLNYGEEDTRQEATPEMLQFEREHRAQVERDAIREQRDREADVAAWLDEEERKDLNRYAFER